MNKFGYRGISLVMLALLCVYLPSCKEDEPPAKPKLSFAEKNMTFKESDGEVEIELILDKAATQDIEIDYSISGTAGEEVKVGNNGIPDYKITTDYLKVQIDAGETKGVIKLEFFSDLALEEDETIEIQIEDVDFDGIEVTRDDETNITVQQEDGLLVVLAWGVGTGENYKDVDMDLFLWAEDETSTLGNTGIGSVQASTQSPEYFFLPSAAINDGTYGLSCTYYSGTVEPMNFQVSLIEVVNGSDASTVTKKGTYQKVNINEWDNSGIDPQLVMTFEKVGTDFKDFSEIAIPSSGSRQSTALKLLKPSKRTIAGQ